MHTFACPIPRRITRCLMQLLFLLCLTGTGCTPSLPQHALPVQDEVRITPDYMGVTIPYNIAPLNFRIMERAERTMADIHAENGRHIIIRGHRKNIRIPRRAWKELLSQNKDKDLCITIYIRYQGQWRVFDTFRNHIAADPIDPWLGYRLSDPGYTTYGFVGLYQRHLESYRERLIYSNRQDLGTPETHYIGRPAVRDHSGKDLMFGLKQAFNDMIVVRGETSQKIHIEADSLGTPPLFAAWHPTEPVVVCSVNHGLTALHSSYPERVDYIDYASDLVLYNMDDGTVRPVTCTMDQFETQPVWSPDGKQLYFCSAACPAWTDTVSIDRQRADAYAQIRYDVFRMAYDASTQSFGPADTVFSFARTKVSAAFPQPSPDGKYLLVSLSHYGSLPVYHVETETYLIDLEHKQLISSDVLNGRFSDFTHAWSSDGRWIVLCSRRDDSMYARPYFSYFDREGIIHKSFLLPRKKQMDHVTDLHSFTDPFLLTSPVAVRPSTLLRTVHQPKDDADADYLP